MKWFQVREASGQARLGLLDDGRARVLKAAHDGVATTLDLFEAMERRKLSPQAWADAAERAGAFEHVEWSSLVGSRLTTPVTTPEAWGAGVTYRRSAEFREEGTGMYDHVYDADRPELFFKATASRCAGPGEPVGKRADSKFTAAEPELALVLASDGSVLGYTLANDVSAWDIERENALYLPQSKVYQGCFSFGPVIVSADEIKDPYALTLRMRVFRGPREVFSGEAGTKLLRRELPELVKWLMRSNPIPTGTVLSTGTGIIQPTEAGLEAGDVVAITCPEIGELANPVVIV
jgi:2-dehydro-3-deoxy-D-arabinonate dehydratase